jgi:hypothetical protein
MFVLSATAIGVQVDDLKTRLAISVSFQKGAGVSGTVLLIFVDGVCDRSICRDDQLVFIGNHSAQDSSSSPARTIEHFLAVAVFAAHAHPAMRVWVNRATR